MSILKILDIKKYKIIFSELRIVNFKINRNRNILHERQINYLRVNKNILIKEQGEINLYETFLAIATLVEHVFITFNLFFISIRSPLIYIPLLPLTLKIVGINDLQLLLTLSFVPNCILVSLIIDSYFTNLRKEISQNSDSLNSNFSVIYNNCQGILNRTWNKTNDCYLDTIEAFPEELQRWEERNLKYVAYLVLAWDLLGFFVYFSKKLISNAIATRRVSS